MAFGPVWPPDCTAFVPNRAADTATVRLDAPFGPVKAALVPITVWIYSYQNRATRATSLNTGWLMLLNLNDPQSIFQWWQVWPERHNSFLEYKLKASPEFGPAIREALRLIAARPELRALRATLSQVRPAAFDDRDAGNEEASPRPSYKELLAA